MALLVTEGEAIPSETATDRQDMVHHPATESDA